VPTTPRISLLIVLSTALGVGARAEDISRSFELRYVTAGEKANGETDFKGKTSIFTTEQRLEFLNQYEKFAGRFFGDKNWNMRIVSDEEVRQTLRQLKPQPLPEVRRRLSLADWKYVGSRPGQREEELRSLAAWKALPGVRVESCELVLSGAEPGFEKTFAPQPWRFSLQWRVLPPASGQQTVFDLDGVAEVGLGSNGRYFLQRRERATGRDIFNRAVARVESRGGFGDGPV
jgi:hypothetical protein